MKKTINVCDLCEDENKAISKCCICNRDVCRRCAKPYVLEDKRIYSDLIFGIVIRSTHDPKFPYICKGCKNKLIEKIRETSKIDDSTKRELFKDMINKIIEILDPYVVANKI